jgi:hypothetical protein
MQLSISAFLQSHCKFSESALLDREIFRRLASFNTLFECPRTPETFKTGIGTREMFE